MTDDLGSRLKAMNPEPFGDPSPAELAAVFAVVEARRSTMTVDEARDTASTQRPVGVWRRRVVAFAGMALLMILVVGGAAVLYRSGDAPVADIAPTTTLPPTTEPVPPTTDMVQPTPSTTVAETSTTTIAEPTAIDLVSVERVTDDSLEKYGMRIWDLAVGGPGIVAVGEVETGGEAWMDAVVLVSSDGRSWDRVDDPELFGGDGWDELHAVWSSPVGLIAQGRDSEATDGEIVWYASTDGINWSLVTDEDLDKAWARESRIGDTWIEFLEGGPGWVAALYRDSDGAERSVNATMGCFGYPSRECENPVLLEVLVSSDGIDWETTTESLESLVDPRPQAPPGPGPTAWDSEDSGYPWNLAWDNDQVVAVRYHEQPKVGISTDGGETWLQVDPEAFGDDHLLITIEVLRFGDYYVIGGNSSTSAEVWILEWNEDEDT